MNSPPTRASTSTIFFRVILMKNRCLNAGNASFSCSKTLRGSLLSLAFPAFQ